MTSGLFINYVIHVGGPGKGPGSQKIIDDNDIPFAGNLTILMSDAFTALGQCRKKVVATIIGAFYLFLLLTFLPERVGLAL